MSRPWSIAVWLLVACVDEGVVGSQSLPAAGGQSGSGARVASGAGGGGGGGGVAGDVDDDRCAEGPSCVSCTSSDTTACPAGLARCREGYCAECVEDDSCPSGQQCDDGVCEPEEEAEGESDDDAP